jgi:dTDP-4-dehydrorhamnose 3,5-epimerase
MTIVPLPLDGMFEVVATPVGDARGRFARLFCEQEFAAIRPGLHFTQVNLSETAQRGTVRGLHYQVPPLAEAKLVRCLRGRVFDVAVDLRPRSPTFLAWHAVQLSPEAGNAVFIPEGCAHGFQALTDDVQLLYLHTTPWSQAHERGLRHDDPRLGIAWPLPAGEVSDRDRGHPLLDAGFAGVTA